MWSLNDEGVVCEAALPAVEDRAGAVPGRPSLPHAQGVQVGAATLGQYLSGVQYSNGNKFRIQDNTQPLGV